jgi:hypothetical protein
MHSVDFVEGIPLLLGAVKHIDNLAFFDFCIERIEDDLSANVRTMRLS